MSEWAFAVSVKEGVVLPPVLHLLAKVALVYQRHAAECRITSGMDGKHMVGSRHYLGFALDFGTRSFAGDLRMKIAEECRDALGTKYDVLLEADHLHVEYDPKE